MRTFAVLFSLATLTILSELAMGQDKYPLLPETPKYVCDQLLLGEKYGKPLKSAALGFFEKLVGVRYDVESNGLDKVLTKGKKGILFLPNHDGPNGPIVMLSALSRKTNIRPVMTEDMTKGAVGPALRYLIGGVNGLLLPNPATGGVTGVSLANSVIGEISNALNHGDNILLYGSGTVQASKEEHLGNNSAIETLLKANPDIRIVLVRERGLWGSSFSHGAENSDPEKKLGTGKLLTRGLLKGAMMMAANGIVLTPKRPVRLEFFEPDDFPRHGTKEQINRYMEAFYNDPSDGEKRVFVREYRWQFWKKPIRISEEEIDYTKSRKGHSQVVNVELPEINEETAKGLITMAKGIFRGTDVNLDTDLNLEAGLDSLSGISLLTAIEETYNVRLPDDVVFQTLRDLGVMIDKSTSTVTPTEQPGTKISEGWLANPSSEETAKLMEGAIVPELVIKQALSQPQTVIAEDATSGALNYKNLLIQAMAVSSVLKSDKRIGERIGVLLPAAAKGTVLYLAVQLAGKSPVYVNFTASADAIMDSLNSTGVDKILTSRAVVDGLAKLYDMSRYMDRLIFVDDLKLKIVAAMPEALIRYELGKRVSVDYILKDARNANFAVVLFTSGSSAAPKAVGLTHGNILTNVSDVNQVLHIKQSDRLLNFLPPFHSFGHMVNVLSQALGVPSIYHPRPQDAQTLANLIESHRPTIIAGTPSLLYDIAKRAQGKTLDSVRLVFAGAEALKVEQVELFRQTFPNSAIVEGYGATELSPVVAVNPPANTKLNSVGKMMPSLSYKIVGVEDFKEVTSGEMGLLMVRGDSVFPGYLNTKNLETYTTLEDGQAYYNTGDIVREDEDHFIFILGRLGRFRKIKGEMVSLPAIEKVLDAIADPLRPSDENAAKVNGPLIAVESAGDNAPLVLFSVVDLTIEQVQQFMRDRGMRGGSTISEVRRVKEIPMLGTGKTDYKVLQNLLKEENKAAQ
jgi:acyl-CoA synthetase (AMP-forming)/AMP-acid ligase II/acyl carrier protein